MDEDHESTEDHARFSVADRRSAMKTVVHLDEAELGTALDLLRRVVDASEGRGRGGFRPGPTVRTRVDQSGATVVTLEARRRGGPVLFVEEAVSADRAVPDVGEAARRWIDMLGRSDPSSIAEAERLRSYRKALVATVLPAGSVIATVWPGTRFIEPTISIRGSDGGAIRYEGSADAAAPPLRGMRRMGVALAEALTDRDVAHATAFGPLDTLTILIGVAPELVVRHPSPQCAPGILRDLASPPPGRPTAVVLEDAPVGT